MDGPRPTNGQAGGRTTAPSVDPPLDRDLMVTVPDAAQLLGLTSEAVRSRVKRGTLPSRRIAGTVYVLLDGTAPLVDPPNDPPSGPSADRPTAPSSAPSSAPSIDRAELERRLEDHVETLKGEVEHLRVEMRRREETHAEEIRRRDHLLAAALERIPRELEAPLEGREPPVTPSDEPGRGDIPPEPQESVERRSWWKRFFGFE
jgi:hypothetical protein